MGDEFQETLTLQEVESGVELIPTQIIPVALQNASVAEVRVLCHFIIYFQLDCPLQLPQLQGLFL